jgi:hypothetical protein
MVSMRVRKLEVSALHEQTLTRLRSEAASARRRPGLAATLSHPTLATPEASPRRVGEGLGACPELAEGVRARFQWKFMAPMHPNQRT